MSWTGRRVGLSRSVRCLLSHLIGVLNAEVFRTLALGGASLEAGSPCRDGFAGEAGVVKGFEVTTEFSVRGVLLHAAIGGNTSMPYLFGDETHPIVVQNNVVRLDTHTTITFNTAVGTAAPQYFPSVNDSSSAIERV